MFACTTILCFSPRLRCAPLSRSWQHDFGETFRLIQHHSQAIPMAKWVRVVLFLSIFAAPKAAIGQSFGVLYACSHANVRYSHVSEHSCILACHTQTHTRICMSSCSLSVRELLINILVCICSMCICSCLA
jgi:hypothetical protein